MSTIKKQKKIKHVDVIVHNGGSIFMFQPLTQRAKDWVIENVGLESWQWLGNSFVAEHRFACDLVDGMQAASLVVK